MPLVVWWCNTEREVGNSLFTLSTGDEGAHALPELFDGRTSVLVR